MSKQPLSQLSRTRCALAALLSLALLSGCVGRSGTVTDSYCLKANLITISDLDILTDPTAKQIEDHNYAWDASCPPENSKNG